MQGITHEFLRGGKRTDADSEALQIAWQSEQVGSYASGAGYRYRHAAAAQFHIESS